MGIVTDCMMVGLSKRVPALCDTWNYNEWYKNCKQVMITSTSDIKDKCTMEYLHLLTNDIIEITATDIPYKL